MSGRVIYSNASMIVGKQYPVVQNNSFDEIVCGIYIIQNVETDQCYVGASINVARRWITHRQRLTSPPERSDMDRDFAKNPDNFVFVLLEKCPVHLLEEREIYWTEEHQSLTQEWGYNHNRPYYRSGKPTGHTRIRVPAA